MQLEKLSNRKTLYKVKIKNDTQERARLYACVSPSQASKRAVHQPPAACPYGSSWADLLGPPELPCPESGEPGALWVGHFPDGPSQQLPEQSVQLPKTGALSRAFLLQALLGQAEASLSVDSSWPTCLVLLSCVRSRASSPLWDPRPSSVQTRSGLPRHPGFPGRRVGTGGSSQDRGLSRGITSASEGTRGTAGRAKCGECPGGGAGLGPLLCAVSGVGPPSQPSPEPRDAPKVTAGGGGAGFSAWSRSAAPPAAGVDGPLLPSTEASPAPRAQANTGRGGVGGRRGAGLARQHVPRVCDSCQGTATSADEPAPPSLTRAGPMCRAQGLAPAVSGMHGALAAWAEP